MSGKLYTGLKKFILESQFEFFVNLRNFSLYSVFILCLILNSVTYINVFSYVGNSVNHDSLNKFCQPEAF